MRALPGGEPNRPTFGVPRRRSSADTTTVKARYAIGGILAAALLALPASAAARQGGQVASMAAQQCAQERAAIGRKAFRKKYGAKRTMRACAKRGRTQVVAAVRSASDDCQAELADVGTTNFVGEYGDEPTDSVDYAMDECIAEGVDEILNPDDSDNVEDDTE
jgi:hypothetical protein